MASKSVEEIMEKQRAKGPATILAIGTATPPNCYLQADYPEFYFRVTNSEHKTELKDKFKRICKSLIFLLKRKKNVIRQHVRMKTLHICPCGAYLKHVC